MTTNLVKDIERENNISDFWNELPKNIKTDLEASLQDSNNNVLGKNAVQFISQLKNLTDE